MANDRNAGRKKVPNGVRVTLTVPEEKVAELKNYVLEIQKEAIKELYLQTL